MSEVVLEALRLLEEKEATRTIQLQELRARIDQSVTELDRREGVEGEAFLPDLIDGLEKRHSARRTG